MFRNPCIFPNICNRKLYDISFIKRLSLRAYKVPPSFVYKVKIETETKDGSSRKYFKLKSRLCAHGNKEEGDVANRCGYGLPHEIPTGVRYGM